jgi:hypothetical protein
MKRRVSRNVNGSVPVGTPTFNELYPLGTPERAAIDARMESCLGIEFLPVCIRVDSEMKALAIAEAAEKVARRDAAIKAVAKKA